MSNQTPPLEKSLEPLDPFLWEHEPVKLSIFDPIQLSPPSPVHWISHRNDRQGPTLGLRHRETVVRDTGSRGSRVSSFLTAEQAASSGYLRLFLNYPVVSLNLPETIFSTKTQYILWTFNIKIKKQNLINWLRQSSTSLQGWNLPLIFSLQKRPS